MCTSGVTTDTPPTVDNSSVESSVKSESRNGLSFINILHMQTVAYLRLHQRGANTYSKKKKKHLFILLIKFKNSIQQTLNMIFKFISDYYYY